MTRKKNLFGSILAGAKSALAPLSPALRRALLCCLLVALAFGGANFAAFFRPYGFLTAALSGIAFLAATLALAAALTLLHAALKRLRWQALFAFLASVILCATLMPMLVYVVPLLLFSTVAAYLAFMSASGKYAGLGKPKKALRYGALALCGAVCALILALVFLPGPAASRPDAARLALPYYYRIAQSPAAPALRNPAAPGGYRFSEHFYASAGQRRDPFPGRLVLPAQTADASDMLEGWSGIRRRRLGFGPDALPLNAQVWMPEGTGPFPIALIAHGNHPAGRRSDVGYAYLGELLASRGIIAASIDKNFLNSSVFYDLLIFAGLSRENGARAFVMLEHLRQWHSWNSDPAHPFYGKVDFDSVALIGHSRGGEAAALAAAFAELERYPGNGVVEFNYPFRINAVVAIAPTHRQYDPAGTEVRLSGVSYLVLHGGHDNDVFSFMGADMFRQADVSERGMKARVWMQHANHGQFNSAWGRNDFPGIWNLITNRRMRMPIEEQQAAAKVFISAFLEAALHGREEYAALFGDFARMAQWLPPTLYITDFADSGMVLLDSFDSGFDLGMSTSGLVAYSARGFDMWTLTALPGKMGSRNNRVLTLRWENNQAPVFKAEFAEGVLLAGDYLYVSLSSGNESANMPNVSFSIRLTDRAGRSSEAHVNDFGGVVNPIDTPNFTPLYLAITGRREPVLQMIRIPTERFVGLSGEIASMEWIMDSAHGDGAVQTLFVDDLRARRGL